MFNVFSDIIMLNSDGIHTKFVYIADRSETGDVIVGRPEFTSLADLKGKKVSFEGINSFSHLFVLKAREESGIEEYDVAFENVSAMGVLNALEENKIGAGHTWEPVTSEALTKAGEKVSLYNSGSYIMDFYIRRGQLSKKLDLETIIEPEFLSRIKKEQE